MMETRRSSDLVQQDAMVRAVHLVLAKCHASQRAAEDAVVSLEIQALHTILEAISIAWPLPNTVKNRINLGPVAAKNIADWNPELADSLMTLDYALRNDGKGLAEHGNAFSSRRAKKPLVAEPAIASAAS